MFPQGVSNTALITAAARAVGNNQDSPLVIDPYSELLAGEDGKKLLQEFGELFALLETIRTKFFDDAVLEAVKSGKKQVVDLGAGLDTRPYRMDLPKDLLWFEVDYAPILEYKRKILANSKPAVVPIDIHQDVTKLSLQDLVSKGFDPSKQSVWVAEGLIAYLTGEQAEQLLDLISAASKSGSELIFNCPNKATMQFSDATKKRIEFMNRLDAKWVFSGWDRPAEMLSKHGFDSEVVFLGHKKAHYGVLPWPPVDKLPDYFVIDWYIKAVRNR